jgi:hypothetical protein
VKVKTKLRNAKTYLHYTYNTGIKNEEREMRRRRRRRRGRLI